MLRVGSVKEFQPPTETPTEEVSTRDQEWRLLFLRLCSRTTWTSALKIQAIVVRNAAGSIACAWIPNAFYALGDIFSGKWYTDQSRNELLVSNSVYAGIAFCTVVFISFMPMMLSLRFGDTPESQPTGWFCVKRLMRATRVYFLATMIILFGFSYLIAYLDSIVPGLFTFKIECYADNLILLGYFTGITRAVKQIYYEETCQGRDRLQNTRKKSKRTRILPRDVTSIAQTTVQRTFRRHHPSFWYAYLNGLPAACIPLIAGLFVHVLSHQRIVDRGKIFLSCFVVAGIVLKLSIQELAKRYIFKKRVRSARTMCILVGIPTVLIDTQTRIILLGTNSTQTAIVGALGMSIVEITLRAGKAALVIMEIRHHRDVHKRKTPSNLQQRTILEMFARHSRITSIPETRMKPRPSMSTGLSEFELWRRQMQAFHTAELNADMYAEYISIGCSASILFFYGSHPHYSLLRQTVSPDAPEVDVMAWRVSQLSMLVVQIGIEVIVDYVSIVFEIAIGIEFDHVKNLGSFLAALFMVAAVMNITLSIGYYLS